MRVAVEYIFDTSKILVRLLDEPDIFSPVQTGTYIVDASPEIQRTVEFEITSDLIVNGEARVYLTGFYPTPSQVKVILPDLTEELVVLNKVKQKGPPLLAEQKTETIEKPPERIHYPGHATYKPDKMSDPEFPPFWVELNFSSTSPLRVGAGMTSDILQYTGGVADRILNTNIKQPEPNYPAYKLGAPTHIEGSFTNSLSNSDLSSTYTPPGMLDPFPTGWSVSLSDPDNLLRTKVNFLEDVLLPHFQTVYYLRPGYINLAEPPPVTFFTPPIAASEYFQVLVIPEAANALGLIQLRSATNLFQTPDIVLDGPKVLKLNVGGDPGPVKIIWKQPGGNDGAQVITLYGPMSTGYPTNHTYIPEGSTNAADTVTIDNLLPTKWNFSEGFIRLESDQETLGEPLSWTLKFDPGDILFDLTNGILSSDFSSGSLNLASYLPLTLETAGNYKFRWSGVNNFELFTKIPNQPEVKTTIPFALDIAIPDALLSEKMHLDFRSFGTGAGSSRLKYFTFKLKEKTVVT